MIMHCELMKFQVKNEILMDKSYASPFLNKLKGDLDYSAPPESEEKQQTQLLK